MKHHHTAPGCPAARRGLSRWLCPRCQDLIIAATGSQLVSATEIHHFWACEACGHEFRTTVRWVVPADDAARARAVAAALRSLELVQA